MELIKEGAELFVPKDFGKYHHYYADEAGTKEYSGVTTILGVIAKPALIQWAANEAVKHVKAEFDNIIFPSKEDDGIEHVDCSYARLFEILEEARYAHKKKKEDAAEKGTDLHALVEEWVGEQIRLYEGRVGAPDNLINERFAPIRKFIDWAAENNIKFIASEKRLYSKKWWVAGTCDLIFEKDGKRYVGDIKTYKKIWDRTPFFQCAGYAMMWFEMHNNGGPILNPEGEIEGSCVLRLSKDGSFEALWSFDAEGDKEGFISAVKLYRALQAFGEIKTSL